MEKTLKQTDKVFKIVSITIRDYAGQKDTEILRYFVSACKKEKIKVTNGNLRKIVWFAKSISQCKKSKTLYKEYFEGKYQSKIEALFDSLIL